MRFFLMILLFLASLTTRAEGRDDFGNAVWIGATADANDSQAGQSIWLRRPFQCLKPVKTATLYVCGLGAYEVFLNGRKIGDALLAPAWSDYKKTIFYNVIDMSDVFQAKNSLYRSKLMKSDYMISVLLGNGFYHEEGLRYHKLKSNFGPLSLLFHLVLQYEDGTTETIDSDSKLWGVRQSPIVYNSIYGGEDYDATLEGYVETPAIYGWRPAVDSKVPSDNLVPQYSAPIKVKEKFPIAKTLLNHVYDMGQNLAGFPAMVITGKKGQTVKLIVGENIGSDGHIDQSRTGKPYYYTYTLRGARENPFIDDVLAEPESDVSEVWHPRFSYYSFRYIEVVGAVMKGEPNPGDLPVIENLQSCFISNSAQKIGSFECSNPLFNMTYKIIDNSIRSNWMSVWTDSPHREKLGWLEQDWLNGPGLLCNYDCRQMFKQEMQVIADAIHEDGSMPEIAPEYVKFEGSWAPPFQESPEWGGALIALPYLYKEYFGSDVLINKYNVQMKRYFDYLSSKAQNNILNMGLGDWYDFGKDKPGFSQNTEIALVATAHYYRWAKTLGLVDKANQIKQAFIKQFVPKSQAGYAISLVLGLYADGQKKALVDALIADIHSHEDRLTTGDIGTPYLFQALLDNGQGDLLYKMLDQYKLPGYGYQIDKGMTTLTEAWDPDQSSSKNHFMMAHINNHLIQDMVGIHATSDGIVINPRLIGNLMWAKGSTRMYEGEVSVSWKIKNGEFILDVVTPDQKETKINYEEINRMCAARNLKLHCTVRQK